MAELSIFKMGAIGGGIGVAALAMLIFLATDRPEPEEFVFKDVEFKIKDFKLTNISANETKASITFSLTNPNPNTIILETIDYELFAGKVRVAASGVGERLGGAMVGSSGQTFNIIPGLTVEIHDEVVIKKTSSNEEFWDDLQSNNVKWRVKGSYIITEPQRQSGKEYTFDTNL